METDDTGQAETSGPGQEDALQEMLRTARRVTMTSRSAAEAQAMKGPAG